MDLILFLSCCLFRICHTFLTYVKENLWEYSKIKSKEGFIFLSPFHVNSICLKYSDLKHKGGGEIL